MKTFLKINNFKGIDSLELKDLSNVNIICGKNNTCKTSVLKAAFISDKTKAGGFFDHIGQTLVFHDIAKDVTKSVHVTTDEYFITLNSENKVLCSGSGGWQNLQDVFSYALADRIGFVGKNADEITYSLNKNDKATQLQSLVNLVLPDVKASFSNKLPNSRLYIIKVLATMLLCVDTLLIDDFDGKLDDELSEKLLEVVISYCKENEKQIFIVTNKVEQVRKQTESVSLYKMLYHPRTNKLIASHYDHAAIDYALAIGKF